MRPQSTQFGLPLFLEDSTGDFTVPTSFRDLYDRLHLSSTPLPASQSPKGFTNLLVRCSGRQTADCLLTLPSSSKSSDGAMVSYAGGARIPVESYLRKIKGLRFVVNDYPGNSKADEHQFSSRSVSRRFTASDAQTYTWSLTQSNPKGSSTIVWMCHDSQMNVVAEYGRNDPSVTGSECAATLTVEEAWSSIVLGMSHPLTLLCSDTHQYPAELLTTLILIRHVTKL